MVHLIFCLRRRPELSREEFQRYWREQHAPLVKQHAAVLGVRRYVQAHTVSLPGTEAVAAMRGAPEDYDGVAELWFDPADLQGPATPETAAAALALLEDERRFIDLPNSPIFFASDNVVVG